MSYKEINLRSSTTDGANTEIMYEIATARADLIDLIRINLVSNEEDESIDLRKLFSSVIRLLKNMKQGGSIHFFATEDSFIRGTTEAVFLQNKYPELFFVQPKVENGEFVYIKL